MMRFLWVTLLCALPVLAMSGNDNYPTGAAPAGFGNASVACSGLWAVHYNQAGMAYLSQALAGISYENRFTMQGLGIKSLAFALPLKNSAFGMEVVSFGYAKYGESKYGLSYARKLGDNFAAGLQLDYLFTHIAENYGSHGAFAVEAGILAHLTDKLHAGAHLYNPTRTRLASFLVDSISDYT
ncbi:MAG: hypothetical protein ACE5DN_03685, partial [Flavobacteriales bacterium]